MASGRVRGAPRNFRAAQTFMHSRHSSAARRSRNQLEANIEPMNPPLTPPRRGTVRRRTNADSPPGRGRGWVGSWKAPTSKIRTRMVAMTRNGPKVVGQTSRQPGEPGSASGMRGLPSAAPPRARRTPAPLRTGSWAGNSNRRMCVSPSPVGRTPWLAR